jgi:hypothetical protein
MWGLPTTSYATRAGFIPVQPVPFSHRYHTSGPSVEVRGGLHQAASKSEAVAAAISLRFIAASEVGIISMFKRDRAIQGGR